MRVVDKKRVVSPREKRRAVRRPLAPPVLRHCLVVSTSVDRARLFARPATEQGWNVIASNSAASAAREIFQHRIELVIVDLDGVAAEEEMALRSLAEDVASGWGGGCLLVICGPDGDAQGEVWSRQLGAWLYLPGVDDTSDISMVCGEAKSAVDRMRGGFVAAT